MYVKLPSENLNPNSYLQHSIRIYTCGLTTTPRVCGGETKQYY